jgi:hypothetical protein
MFCNVLCVRRRGVTTSLLGLLAIRITEVPLYFFYFYVGHLTTLSGRDIAQWVSRRLPTAAVRVRAQVRLCGICGGKSGTGAGFLWALRSPLPILIPQTAPNTHTHTHQLSSGAGTTGQLVADVPSGLSLTPSQANLKRTNEAASIETMASIEWVTHVE